MNSMLICNNRYVIIHILLLFSPFCVSVILSLNPPQSLFSFANIIMPNHTLNQIERNIDKDNIIKDIKSIFRLEKRKDKGIKDYKL